MPSGLRRFHHTGQTHFVTFSCYRRRQRFDHGSVYDLFLLCLEDMRVRFRTFIFGYVVIPEHLHILLSEPEIGTLADAIHYLKLSFSKRHTRRAPGPFWQKRYYDRNARTAEEFSIKLRYLHRNPGSPESPLLARWGGIR